MKTNLSNKNTIWGFILTNTKWPLTLPNMIANEVSGYRNCLIGAGAALLHLVPLTGKVI